MHLHDRAEGTIDQKSKEKCKHQGSHAGSYHQLCATQSASMANSTSRCNHRLGTEDDTRPGHIYYHSLDQTQVAYHWIARKYNDKKKTVEIGICRCTYTRRQRYIGRYGPPANTGHLLCQSRVLLERHRLDPRALAHSARKVDDHELLAETIGTLFGHVDSDFQRV